MGGPSSKRVKKRHLQLEEEEPEEAQHRSSEALEQGDGYEEIFSGNESEEGDSDGDMVDSDNEDEGEDDEEGREAKDTKGIRLGHGRGDMEELEEEYQRLRHQEMALLSTLKRQKDEDAIKGLAIKNQKALWNRNLEFRFLLQKAFSSSNKLPQEPQRFEFFNHDTAVEKAYSELILSTEQTLSRMLELQEALLEKNNSISQDIHDTSNKLTVGNDDQWSQIQRTYCSIAPFRNNSVDKWQRKTQVTSGAAAFKGKLHAFNQNISDQVSAYMKDPSRMIERMQLKRFAVDVLGQSAVEVGTESREPGDVEAGNAGGDPELIDDSEFYQQLLKEFFDSSELTSEPSFCSFKKSHTRKRKTVDRRASKSRKIRYNVHEKIVNFMAPKPMVLPPMAPKLFENLFGLREKRVSSIQG